jgi:hypothetical protein
MEKNSPAKTLTIGQVARDGRGFDSRRELSGVLAGVCRAVKLPGRRVCQLHAVPFARDPVVLVRGAVLAWISSPKAPRLGAALSGLGRSTGHCCDKILICIESRHVRGPCLTGGRVHLELMAPT